MDWNAPDDLDDECLLLCQAMNGVLGIHTVESCAGHGTKPLRIWFQVEDIDDLPALLYWFDSCHCGFPGWVVHVRTDCAYSEATFCLEGPVGEKAYVEANTIANLLEGSTGDVGEQTTDTKAEETEASPIEHELRCHPPLFGYVQDGSKPFEVRRADRPFAVGDTLLLREWDPKSSEYTGRICRRCISYLLDGGEWGIEQGYCVMGLQSETNV